MKRRKWDPRTKTLIVLEGLKGKLIADICTEHQISQAQYYQWREQVLTNLPQVFTKEDKKNKRLTQENARLRRMIGDLTVELKKQKSGSDEAADVTESRGTESANYRAYQKD